MIVVLMVLMPVLPLGGSMTGSHTSSNAGSSANATSVEGWLRQLANKYGVSPSALNASWSSM